MYSVHYYAIYAHARRRYRRKFFKKFVDNVDFDDNEK